MFDSRWYPGLIKDNELDRFLETASGEFAKKFKQIESDLEHPLNSRAQHLANKMQALGIKQFHKMT